MSTLSGKPSRPAQPKRPRRDDFVSLDGLLTVADWEALPETKPAYELIDGKLVQKKIATNQHNWAVSEAVFAFDVWADTSGWRFFSRGSGVRLDDHSGYVPDVMGFPPHVHLDPEARVNPVPMVVAEGSMPGKTRLDRGIKKVSYARAGVALYILIDPDAQAVEVFRSKNGRYGKPEKLAADAVWEPAELPGLRLELARLWM